jgi:hypothetical protein
MNAIVALVIHIAGIIAFIWFVFFWANLFSRHIEPVLRQAVSRRLGIEIVRWEKGPRYHWATPDVRPKSRLQVFLWGALLFFIIGSGPMIAALLVVGLLLNTVND